MLIDEMYSIRRGLVGFMRSGLERGEVADGALYVVVILVVIGSAGFLFSGSLPSPRTPKTIGQQVMVLSPSPQNARSNLQLYTFNGVPVTPTSSPVAIAPSGSLEDCGNNLAFTSEPQTLYAYNVGASAASGNQLALKVFYSDEWPLTLGSGTVSPMNQQPSDHVSNPNVGDTSQRDSAGLPYFPSVFLTDVTSNAKDNSGDAEKGGTPQKPNDVYGAWKALGMSDPLTMGSGNGNTIASGADPMPSTPNGPGYMAGGIFGGTGMNFGGSSALEWTAEIIWNVSGLQAKGQPLQSGHTYRAEVVLHDGDKDGDIGEACANIKVP